MVDSREYCPAWVPARWAQRRGEARVVITIGVDRHKSVHHATAVDAVGKARRERRGENSPAGWGRARRWAAGLGGERRWGVEGAWTRGHGLGQYLVGQGELVYDVPPR